MEENSNGVVSLFNILSYSAISIPVSLFFIALLYIVLHNNKVKKKSERIKKTERKGFMGLLTKIKNFIVFVFLIIRFYAQVYVFSLMIIFTFWKYILKITVSPMMNGEFYIALIMTLIISIALEKSKQEKITTIDIINFIKKLPSIIRGERK